RTATERPVVALDLEVGNEVSQPALAPDGSQVAFVSKGQLAVRRLDQATITPLAGTEGATYPFFSPDGKWIAFFARGKLQKIAVDGGAPVALCTASGGRGGSWGQDDKIIAALNLRTELSRVSASG